MGIIGGQGLSLLGALHWESHSMTCLSWPTDYNIQWVGQGEGSLAAKSSAALNKEIDVFKLAFISCQISQE